MRQRPTLSLKGDPNAPTTAQPAPAVAAPNSPTQEKTMEASPDKTSEVSQVAQAALIEPTAKAMAEAEEANVARLLALSRKNQAEAEAANREPVSIIGLAAQGREALLEGLRQHQDRTKPAEYVPPPRTPRQMAQLEAELAAGRRVQQKAAEQLAHRPAPERDRNEGLTTPVHRPDDFVPGLYSRDPAKL